MAERRKYAMNTDGLDLPEWITGAGHLYRISGILLQGKDENYLVPFPTADGKSFWEQELGKGITYLIPTLEQWSAFIARTDDPIYFDQTGLVKTIHRKTEAVISGAVQQKMWARDGFRCLYCGKKMGNVQLTIDHFVPLELGGSGNDSNLISACRLCNKKKGDVDPQKFCEDNGLDYEGLTWYLGNKGPLSLVAHLVGKLT